MDYTVAHFAVRHLYTKTNTTNAKTNSARYQFGDLELLD